MANIRKEGKRMVKDKLKQIKFDTKFITEHVESLCSEAEKAGDELLHDKDKHLFLEHFHPVMNRLDTTARKLFLLKASICEESDGSSSSSSDSDGEQQGGAKQNKNVNTTGASSAKDPPHNVSDTERSLPATVSLSTETSAEKSVTSSEHTSRASDEVCTNTENKENKDALLKDKSVSTNQDGKDSDSDVKVDTTGSVQDVNTANSQVGSQQDTCLPQVSERKPELGQVDQSSENVGTSDVSIDQKEEVATCGTEVHKASNSRQGKKADMAVKVPLEDNERKEADQKVDDYFLKKRKIGETPVVKSLGSKSTCSRGSSSLTPQKCETKTENQETAVTPSSYLPPVPSEGTASNKGKIERMVSENTVTPGSDERGVNKLKSKSPELEGTMSVRGRQEETKTSQKANIKLHVVKDGKSAPKIRKVKVKTAEKASAAIESDDALRDYVVNYGTGPEIPRLKIKDGQTLDIMITEVNSPSLFWVQNCGESAKLNELMEELCSFHRTLVPGDPLIKLKYRPAAGTVLAAQFTQDNNWYRARVLSRWYKKDTFNACDKGSHLVNVLYIDYGNQERLSINRLRPLHPDHSRLPAQAFPCALSEVGPVCSEWTSVQCQEFASFMLSKEDIHGSFTSLPGSSLAFCHLYVPKQVPLPTLSLFPGPRANELVDVGETLIKESKQAVKVSNEEIFMAFKESSQSLDPDPRNPELKCFITTVEVHAHNYPEIYDDTPKPFLTDTMEEDCQCSDSPSTQPGNGSMKQQDQKSELDPTATVTRSSPSPPLTGRSSDQEQEKLGATFPRIPQACLRSLSRDENTEVKSNGKTGELGNHTKACEGRGGFTGNQDSSINSCDNSSGDRASVGKCSQLGNQSSKDKGEGSRPGNQSKRQKTESKCSEASASTGKSSEIGKQAKKVNARASDGSGNSGKNSEIGNQTTPIEQRKDHSSRHQAEESGMKRVTEEEEKATGGVIPVPERTDRQMASASFPDMCITVPEDGRLPFVMSFIFNPNCFFIHLISLDSAKTVDKLMNELNAYYSSESTNSLLLKKFISEGVPTPGDIVCACFSEDSRYYRAQVLNVKTVTIEGKEFTRVQVFYVDFGNKEWLPREQIYPLPPRFAEHPPQAVCCTLTGVRQVKMKETNTSADQGEDEGWDVELTREFVKLTGFDKELYGFVVGAREGEVLRPSKAEPIKLLVLDTNADQDVWINEEMHRLKIAVFHPPPEYYEQMKKLCCPAGLEEEIQGWDPMEEAFLSERNSYLIDTDDPGVATAGYSTAEDDQWEDVLQKVKVTSYVDLWMNHMSNHSTEPKERESIHGGIIPCKNARLFAKYVDKVLNPFYVGKEKAKFIGKILDNDFNPGFKKRLKKCSLGSVSVTCSNQIVPYSHDSEYRKNTRSIKGLKTYSDGDPGYTEVTAADESASEVKLESLEKEESGQRKASLKKEESGHQKEASETQLGSYEDMDVTIVSPVENYTVADTKRHNLPSSEPCDVSPCTTAERHDLIDDVAKPNEQKQESWALSEVIDEVCAESVVKEKVRDVCKTGRKSEKKRKFRRHRSKKKKAKHKAKLENEALLSRQLLSVRGLLEINAVDVNNNSVKESAKSKENLAESSSVTESYKTYSFNLEESIEQKKSISVKQCCSIKDSQVDTFVRQRKIKSSQDVSALTDDTIFQESSDEEAVSDRRSSKMKKRGKPSKSEQHNYERKKNVECSFRDLTIITKKSETQKNALIQSKYSGRIPEQEGGASCISKTVPNPPKCLSLDGEENYREMPQIVGKSSEIMLSSLPELSNDSCGNVSLHIHCQVPQLAIESEPGGNFYPIMTLESKPLQNQKETVYHSEQKSTSNKTPVNEQKLPQLKKLITSNSTSALKKIQGSEVSNHSTHDPYGKVEQHNLASICLSSRNSSHSNSDELTRPMPKDKLAHNTHSGLETKYLRVSHTNLDRYKSVPRYPSDAHSNAEVQNKATTEYSGVPHTTSELNQSVPRSQGVLYSDFKVQNTVPQYSGAWHNSMSRASVGSCTSGNLQQERSSVSPGTFGHTIDPGGAQLSYQGCHYDVDVSQGQMHHSMRNTPQRMPFSHPHQRSSYEPDYRNYARQFRGPSYLRNEEFFQQYQLVWGFLNRPLFHSYGHHPKPF